MSMTSAQCDELRKAADELQNLIDNGHNYTWSGLFATLHYAQQELRSAAELIWELRNELAGTVDQQDEIKRLEEENAELKKAMDFQALELGCMTDNRDVLYVENAKQRELVRTMMRFFEDDDWCTTCWCAKECDAQEQYEDDCLMRDVFRDRMRELGIEVE